MDLKRVLFVCHGNINRSPAAELLWKDKVHGNVKSCGLSKKYNLSISKNMRTVLAELGIDTDLINMHRSYSVSIKLLLWSTSVFCMSEKHRDTLIDRYPMVSKKVYVLPHQLSCKTIHDPAFGTINMHRAVCQDIIKCIDKLLGFKVSFPIVVTSKKRASYAPFIKILERLKIGYILTLEKEDISGYEKAYEYIDDIISLKESNRGLGYSRYHTLKYMSKEYGGWFWLLDDDFTGFSKYSVLVKKFTTISFEEFISKGEAVINHYKYIKDLAMVGYRQTSFGMSKKPLVFNTRVIQFVAINTNALGGLSYNFDFVAMSDEVFLMDLFIEGLYTLKINHYMYKCPYSGELGQVGGHNYKKTPKIDYVRMLRDRHRKLVSIDSENKGLNMNPKYSIKWGKIKPAVPDVDIVDPDPIYGDRQGINKWL